MNEVRAQGTGRATTAGRLRPEVRRRPAAGPGTPPWTSTFLRGLAVGALVGAAIAGSAIRERGRPTRESRTGR